MLNLLRRNLLRYLEIHQSHYIQEIREKFKDQKIHISSLPIIKVFSNVECSAAKSYTDLLAKLQYRSVLGCMSFLANLNRPDTSSVNLLSEFQATP